MPIPVEDLIETKDDQGVTLLYKPMNIAVKAHNRKSYEETYAKAMEVLEEAIEEVRGIRNGR